MVRGDRSNCFLKLRKRSSRLEKGVSLMQGEALFNTNQRPLYLLIVVSTPLSIRRGVGGEALSNWLPLGTPPLGGGWVGLFHSERGRG